MPISDMEKNRNNYYRNAYTMIRCYKSGIVSVSLFRNRNEISQEEGRNAPLSSKHPRCTALDIIYLGSYIAA